MKKISKYWTLVLENGVAAALFNHRTHIIYYNFCRRPLGANDLPVNEFKELSIDSFYNKLEKIESK